MWDHPARILGIKFGTLAAAFILSSIYKEEANKRRITRLGLGATTSLIFCIFDAVDAPGGFPVVPAALRFCSAAGIKWVLLLVTCESGTSFMNLKAMMGLLPVGS